MPGEAHGVAPLAGDVAGVVHGDFHHQLRVDECDVQDVTAAPPGGERASCPRMAARRRTQQPRLPRRVSRPLLMTGSGRAVLRPAGFTGLVGEARPWTPR